MYVFLFPPPMTLVVARIEWGDVRRLQNTQDSIFVKNKPILIILSLEYQTRSQLENDIPHKGI